MASTTALQCIGEVVDLAHGSESPQAFDRQLLALLDRRVGFDVAFVALRDRARPLLTLRGLASERASAGLPDPVFASMLRDRREIYNRELAPVRSAALSGRGVAVDTEVLSAGALRESAYHRELRVPVGGKHSLLAYANVHGSELVVMLGRTGSSFRAQASALVEDLLPAITLAHASLAAQAARHSAADALGARGGRTQLTPREREVLQYLCLGYTNREIALACGSSPNTVRNQLANIFAKVGATTRAEAVGLALGGVGP